MVRRRGGRKRALGTRAPMELPHTSNQRGSLDYPEAPTLHTDDDDVLTIISQHCFVLSRVPRSALLG